MKTASAVVPLNLSSLVRTGGAGQFLMLVVILGAVAALAPAPYYATDRGTYESIGREYIVPDCSSLHCFRLLVAWVLETLPGPSLLKWKLYAALSNAGAAVALARLCLVLGFSSRAAGLASWIAALGFGSLFTLYDPHTSDPLMYLLGPLILIRLLQDRVAAAGALSAVGVFAKEFAAAPLWIFTLYAALARRWTLAARALVAANFATLVWLALQLWLMLRYDYGYADSPSTDLLGGGYLRWWISYLGPANALWAIFIEFGALFLLMPFGFVRGPQPLRQFAIAAVPAALLFAYVQQPDRALWNFHFVAIPLAVLVLDRLPDLPAWLFVASYGLANLRFGAQLGFVAPARFPLALSLALALYAVVAARRKPMIVAGATSEFASR